MTDVDVAVGGDCAIVDGEDRAVAVVWFVSVRLR